MDKKLEVDPKKPVRPFLEEIYRIRQQHVAYLSGEIGRRVSFE